MNPPSIPPATCRHRLSHAGWSRLGATLGLLLGLLVPLAAQAKPPSVTLACGGIGEEESNPMLTDAANHALTIIFAGSGGAYLSGVQTQVSGPPGVSAKDDSCGPIGQVDVSRAGRYTVQATYAGKRQDKTLNLAPKGGGRLVLRWPED